MGANSLAALPVSRGFDESLGFWSGGQDYLTHWDVNSGGYDMMQDARAPFNNTVRIDQNNTWTTEIFTRHAVDTISRFSPASEERLFLYLAYQNVHWPLMAPADYVARFANTTGGNKARQLVAAMASFLDDGVGNVTAALRAAGIFNDTTIIFTSDNGGPTHGDEQTESNNYPLRGGKNTLFEGGTRVVGLVSGAGVEKTGYTNTEKVHATDWLPSLVSMATGGEDFKQFAPPGEPPYLLGDGVDVWATIAAGAPSPRDWLLLEAHAAGKGAPAVHGDALIVGDWKIYRRGADFAQVENGWWPPPGQDPAGVRYTLSCGAPQPPAPPSNTSCMKSYCLFNVTRDPCEYFDVAAEHPDVVAALTARLADFQATAVPPEAGSGCAMKKVSCGDAFCFFPCDLPSEVT